MSYPDLTCFLCGQRKDVSLRPEGSLDEIVHVECPYCRPYSITDEGIRLIRSQSSGDRFHLASYNCYQWLASGGKQRLLYYRQSPPTLKPKDRVIDEILNNWWPIPIRDRLDKILLNLFHVVGNKPGHAHTINPLDAPFCLAEDLEGIRFNLIQLRQAGVIDFDPDRGGPFMVGLTVAGYDRIYDLEKGITSKESRKVFVAMSFAPSLNEIYELAIKPAIEACGYKPFRIDKEEHNEKICDKIEAAIRQARFVVADFTQNNHGVYYEAGMARGLGLQIVWTAKEGETLHFDTRQYNHIFWSSVEDFKVRLEVRIRALGI